MLAIINCFATLFVLLRFTSATQHEFTVHASWESYRPVVPIRLTLQLPSGSSSGTATNKASFRLCYRNTSLSWPRCDNSSQANGGTPICQQIGNIGVACVTSLSSCNVPLPSVQDWYMFRLQVGDSVSTWLPLCDPEGLLRVVTPSTLDSTVASLTKPVNEVDAQASTVDLKLWQIVLIAAGGVLIVVLVLIILICCGCFQKKSSKYTVQSSGQESKGHLNNNLLSYGGGSRHGSRSSLSATGSTLSLTKRKTSHTDKKKFWKDEERSVEIRPDIDIVPVYNNPLNDFVKGATNTPVPATNRNKRTGLLSANGDVILHPIAEEDNEESTFSSFVTTRDHTVTIHTDTQEHPISFSQAVGLRIEQGSGRDDASELDEAFHTELADDTAGNTAESHIETSTMTTSL